ncbi:MAG: hypothetical protein ACXWLM_03055 [Myxococcales bacterium]
MQSRLALVLLLAIAPALHAQETESLRDDPAGRLRARLLMQGEPTPEQQLHVLNEAAAEAAKWGIGQHRTAAAVSAAAWVNVGPASGTQVSPTTQAAADTGRIRKIVPHPTDANILYVATAGGGVWKSFDAQSAITLSSGPHWASITSGLLSQSVGAFALDPNSPDTLFLGLGDPFDVHTPGFYTSLDGGITWQGPVGLTNPDNGQVATSVRDIVVDPSGTGAVVVATNQGVFRQLEGGAWSHPDLGGATSCWSVAWVGPSRWLASCYGQVFLSTDNGVSFPTRPSLPTADVGRMTLASAYSDRADPAHAFVYLLAATAGGGAQSDIFLSTSGGATWGTLNANSASICIAPGQPGCPVNATQDQPDLDVMHDQAWSNQAIVVDPTNHSRVFAGGNLAMIRSNDAGASWYVLTDWLPASPLCSLCRYLPYVHADWHAMAIGTAGATKFFYAGTDGGIFRSADAFTKNPTNANDGSAPVFEGKLGRGLVTHLAYSIATDIHDSTNPTLIGGLQDNGTRLRTAATPTTFNPVIGADGFGVGIGKFTSNSMPAGCTSGKWGSLLLGSIYGVVYRSTDCGGSFAPAMNGICKPQPQILNPGGGCAAEYDSNFYMKLASDQADSTGLTFLTVINNSACDPNQSQCAISAGTNTVYATHDGAGASTGWVNANGDVGNFPAQLTSVSTNPKAAGQWAVTDVDGYAYVTGNSGAHWVKSAWLPGPRYVTFEVAGTGALWAATGGGEHVFRSANGGASWVAKNGTGLPDVPANVIAVDPNSTSTIYLGTEIGLYRSTDAGQTWARYGGSSLPLVSVTEINVALDSSAIRISTFGRGFWELYSNASAPAGVLGNGDLDHNQILDAFDAVREATMLFTSPADAVYDPVGNVTGTTNYIDSSDFSNIVARMGGRP